MTAGSFPHKDEGDVRFLSSELKMKTGMYDLPEEKFQEQFQLSSRAMNNSPSRKLKLYLDMKNAALSRNQYFNV